MSSTSQRCRPTPGTDSGVDGTEIRQRVIVAVGCPKSAGLGLSPPAPQRDADGALALGGELQPARAGHCDTAHFENLGLGDRHADVKEEELLRPLPAGTFKVTRTSPEPRRLFF